MAHNLNYNESLKRHAFFTRKEPAWHNLGVVVERALTSEEAIKAAGLDFEVRKYPCYINSQAHFLTGNKISVPNTFALVREDTLDVLNKPGKTVTKTYEVVQNVEAFNFFDSIIGSKQAIFETAGALGLGERVFITAKLPGNIKSANPDDIIDKYLLLTTSHDGAGAIEAMFTPIRVVCNNTLNLALQTHKNKVSIRHTSSAKDKIREAANLMGLYKAYDEEFSDMIKGLAKQMLQKSEILETLGQLVFTPSEMVSFVKSTYKLKDVPEISTRKKNKFTSILESVDQGVGQDLYRGSKLWLVNGISTFLNNDVEYKSEDDKFKHIMFGSGQSTLQKTFDLVLD
jgi:phage/plasmid-like protein (TIGR03299 family)